MTKGHGAGDARRPFLAGLIDDAALFPPSRLPMDAAVAGHIEHRNGPHAWVQGRFLCPASQLDELARALPATAPEWPVTVIADGDDLAADVRAALRLCEQTDGRAWTHGLETRLPPGEPDVVAATVDAVLAATRTEAAPLALALELPVTGRPPDEVDKWVAAIRDARGAAAARRAGRSQGPVAKLRCGGLVAKAFPTVDQAAAVVRACVAHDVPLKATAGLHHPVRHRDPATGFDHHGFFNLFGALLLLAGGAIDDAHVTAVLGDTDPAAFRLTGHRFRWGDAMVDAATVRTLRDRLVVGYGSCSFDEPVGDLVALGVLTQEH